MTGGGPCGGGPVRRPAHRGTLRLGAGSGCDPNQGGVRDKDPNPALKLLRDKGILTLETSASRGVGDKKELVASLAIPPEEAMALVTPRRRSAPLRYAVTELLCALGSASAKELCYFTGAANATLRLKERYSVWSGRKYSAG
ncbi:MAG: hypothetical protein ACLS63_02970 [Flavonifractor plautii]